MLLAAARRSLVCAANVTLLSRRAVQTAGGSARVRATKERQVIESLGKVIEPLSQESLHSIAAIQVIRTCQKWPLGCDVHVM